MMLMSDKLNQQIYGKILASCYRKLGYFRALYEKNEMGFNEYDDAHVLKICKIAGVDDFSALPKGTTLKLEKALVFPVDNVKQ